MHSLVCRTNALILFSFRTILVQMVSAAGTGYSFNTKRGRLKEKMVLRKHDPLGKTQKHHGFEGHFSGEILSIYLFFLIFYSYLYLIHINK